MMQLLVLTCEQGSAATELTSIAKKKISNIAIFLGVSVIACAAYSFAITSLQSEDDDDDDNVDVAVRPDLFDLFSYSLFLVQENLFSRANERRTAVLDTRTRVCTFVPQHMCVPVSSLLQTEISSEDKRKAHQNQLGKQINDSARVSL